MFTDECDVVRRHPWRHQAHRARLEEAVGETGAEQRQRESDVFMGADVGGEEGRSE
jgi:hypothetical protein